MTFIMAKRRMFSIEVSLSGETTYYSIKDSWNRDNYIIDYCTLAEAKELVKQLKALHKLSQQRWNT